LQYVSAGDVLPVLVSGAKPNREQREQERADCPVAGPAWRESATAATTTRRRRHYWRKQIRIHPQFGGSSGTGGGSSLNISEELSHATSQYDAASGPQSETPSSLRISAANSIIVLGNREGLW